MISPFAVPCGVSSRFGLALRIQIVVMRPARRQISPNFSADRTPMPPKTSRDLGLIKSVLREQQNIAALTCAKMPMGHRRAYFVDGLDNLNLTKSLAMSHLFRRVAFAI